MSKCHELHWRLPHPLLAISIVQSSRHRICGAPLQMARDNIHVSLEADFSLKLLFKDNYARGWVCCVKAVLASDNF